MSTSSKNGQPDLHDLKPIGAFCGGESILSIIFMPYWVLTKNFEYLLQKPFGHLKRPIFENPQFLPKSKTVLFWKIGLFPGTHTLSYYAPEVTKVQNAQLVLRCRKIGVLVSKNCFFLLKIVLK